MLPVVRFNAIVASLTVSTMYLLLAFFWPIGERYRVQEEVHSNFGPFFGPAILAVLGIAGSLGIYRLLLSGLNIILERFQPVRRFVMGPYYVEGTWVGFNTINDEVYYVIDRYEQSLATTVTIRGTGWKILPDKTPKRRANWTARAAFVDAAEGTLNFLCSVSLIEENSACDAITKFNFRRKDDKSPPIELLGYSANITDNMVCNIMTDIYMKKLSSDSDVEETVALQAAIKFKKNWHAAIAG